MQKIDFSNILVGCTLVSGQLSDRVHHLNTINWQSVFQVYIKTIMPCSMCDFAMSSGERDSVSLGFPYLICFASVCFNISAIIGRLFYKNFTPGVKSPLGSK